MRSSRRSLASLARVALVSAALLGSAIGARAEEGTEEAAEAVADAGAPASETVLAVFELKSNDEELEKGARAVAALVGMRLAERPRVRVLGPDKIDEALGERAKRLGACADNECLRTAGSALGAAYVVQGRLDELGDQFVLTASVADASSGAIRARVREAVEEEIDFPYAADRLGDSIGDALGLEKPSFLDLTLESPDDPIAHVNVKFGNTIAALKGFSIDTFTLQFDLEADYYLRRYLLAYLEAGLAVGRAEDQGEGAKGTFSLVPVTLGLKYVLLHQREVRPYAGLGLGLGLIADLVEPEDRKLSLHFKGLVGVAYVPWRHLGFNLESSMNFDELHMSSGSSLLFAFNLNFGVLVPF